MTAVGDILVSRWGDRHRVTYIQQNGDFYLENLTDPGPRYARALATPDSVTAGWYTMETAAAGEGTPPAPNPPRQVACLGHEAHNPSRTTTEEHTDTRVPEPVTPGPAGPGSSDPSIWTPLTLGATRPMRSIASVPHVESWSWIPCLTTSDGTEDGGSHCYFIKSNLELSLWCATCRPNRIRIAEAVHLAPSGPTVRLPPWGDGEPIWGTAPVGMRDKLVEWYEERAAVVEEGSGLPRDLAERHAYGELVKRFTAAVEGARHQDRIAEGAPNASNPSSQMALL